MRGLGDNIRSLGLASLEDELREDAARQAAARAAAREKRDHVSIGTVDALLRERFHIAGQMITSCPLGDRWREALLLAGREVPCETEADALNQLRVMILALASIWGRSDMVFVRVAPEVDCSDGLWHALVRLFMYREAGAS